MVLLQKRIGIIDSTVWENTCQHANDYTKTIHEKCFDLDLEFILIAG